MNIIYYYPTIMELRHYCDKDAAYLSELTGPVDTSVGGYHRLIATEECIGYWYRVGDYSANRGRVYSLTSYVTVWYQDDFRQEYSPEFIKEMEIQEKVWKFKLLFRQLT